MKSPSLQQFFLLCIILSITLVQPLSAQLKQYPYEQSFESAFATGKQLEFLPHWWANEVSSGSSRIYQAGSDEALSGGAALGVAPTGSFSGDIRLFFDASELEGGEVSFWARAGQNGGGSRPAIVSASFSGNGGETFTDPVEIGEDGAFPNEHTEYQQYYVTVPEDVLGSSQAVLRLQVKRGTGEGTAARIFLDDFKFSHEPAAFRLMSAKPLNQNKVELLFNRKLNPETAENEENYQLGQEITVAEALVDRANGRRVVLETTSLQPETLYTLRLGRVLDEEGNSAEGQELSFSWRDLYELGIFDLLVSEIHAAPNESTLLPNVEWVEIYNASGRTIQLEGVRFTDESKSALLPSYALGAGEYLVLAPAADADQLKGYGPVLGLSAWPSLNNGGDVVSLFSPENKLVDRVAYSQSWYGSGQKSKGGWSLERIDLNYPCIGGANWSASMAIPGGTPAQVNSIAGNKPDTRGPELELAFVLDSLTVQLLFNEGIDTTQLSAASINIEPAGAIRKLVPMAERPEGLLLKLAESLNPDLRYRLKVDHVQDCSGNLMENSFTTELAYPKQAGPGDVVINEVMFDPPPNSEEWVEIANASDHYLDLQNWQLATWANGVKATAVLSKEPLILAPEGVLAFSRDVGSVKTAFPSAPESQLWQLPDLPALVNAGDTLALIDSDGKVVDKFRYHESLHSPFVRETKGISLERISLRASTNAVDNWTSAAAMANFGTPGLPNSQRFQETEAREDQLLIEPEVIRPGSPAPNGYASIRFNSDRAGLQLTLLVLDTEGRTIRTLAHNELVGSESFFTWDGTSENNGRVRTGYYIIFLRVFSAEGFKKEFKKVLVVGN